MVNHIRGTMMSAGFAVPKSLAIVFPRHGFSTTVAKKVCLGVRHHILCPKCWPRKLRRGSKEDKVETGTRAL